MAFSPTTNWAINKMGQQGEAPQEAPESADSFETLGMDQQKILQLQMKRRYKRKLIQKMLQEAGFGDLNNMTQVRERAYE